MKRILHPLLIVSFLGSIVLANVIAARYGVSATPYVAAGLIGPILVIRDLLNDSWRRHGSPKMLGLIAAGGAVSYAASVTITSAPPEIARNIAVASAAAFVLSETVDWIVYQLAKRSGWTWLARSNTSNVVGATLDSTAFVSIAFGFAFPVVFAQTVAKIAGGLVYSLLANARKGREVLPRHA